MTAGAPPEPGLVPIRRALLAVADHDGLFELATALHEQGVTLVSTYTTWIALGTAGLMTTPLGGEARPILDGRIETLGPDVHAAVAATVDDGPALAAAGLESFDLVIGNPARFELPAQRPDGTLAMAVAAIDVGGATLLQAAAKNHARVAVVVNPGDYGALLDELAGHGCALTASTRLRLATKAFAATAAHDAAIARYLADLADDAMATPDHVIARPRLGRLVTGPGRRAGLALDEPDRCALYAASPPLDLAEDEGATVVAARVVAGGRGGRAMPAGVVRDLDRALALVRELGDGAAAIVRDDEPVAAGDHVHATVSTLHVLAWAAEVEGLAGASLALDGAPTAALAARLSTSGLAAVIVPAATDDVIEGWPADGPCLLVAPGHWHDLPDTWPGLAPLAWRSIGGGLLIEEVDVAAIVVRMAAVVTARAPTPDELRDLELAARVARHVRAHALVVATAAGTVAIVGGQPDLSRALLAARSQLGDVLEGCVAAVSARVDDPADLDLLAAAGLRALYQPAGSPHDQEVVAAADRQGLAMVVSGLEHLRR